ncbi:MAG TPA: gliding motility protein GldL [Bacteroidetes bacterium]|nr:gliding motility protein GldL [Bacteroidota bacterium]
MNISEIVQSSGWKNFMAKLYGLGASVVIVGALFKIQHWPAAGLFLTVGLLTEATIFFFSAFEPLHEEVDWTLVYPELAGISEDEAEELRPASARSRGGDGSSALEKFDALLEKAEITPDLFRKLGQGMENLSQTASKLGNIADASVVTNEFVGKVKNASESVEKLSGAYQESTEKLAESVGELTDSYKNTATIIAQSGNNYESLSGSILSISEGSKSYNEQLEALNKNLSALNAVYELQLQGTNDQIKATEKMYAGMNEMLDDLKESAQDTKKYREEVSRLSQNLAALNTVYGNMLAAMNVRSNP